jgi:hypothetical protein
MTGGRARVLTAALVAALVLVVPANALAAHRPSYPDTPAGALHDCGAGNYPLKGHYTIRVLQQALKEQLANKLQYTNCATILLDTIHKLELTARRDASAGGSGNARGALATGTRGSGADASGDTSIINRRIGSLKAHGGSPIVLPTGETVTPGAVSLHGASFLSNLPTPLLIVLAALLATVLAVVVRAINNLVRTRRAV